MATAAVSDGQQKPAHTPGPWISSKHGAQVLTADSERSIALLSLPVLHTDPELESVRANARLIASAPDLVAALEWALPLLEDHANREHDDADYENRCVHAVELVRAALSKAGVS